MRKQEHGYSSEEDARPGITSATRKCRNGPDCRFLPNCHYSHKVDRWTRALDEKYEGLSRLRSSCGKVRCSGFKVRNRREPRGCCPSPRLSQTDLHASTPATQYTYTTELWEAAQPLLRDAAGCERAAQTDDPTSSDEYVLVPHAALDAVLAAPGAKPDPPPSDAELSARLQPFLRKALEQLSPQRTSSSGRRLSGTARRDIGNARTAITRLAEQRGVALAERLARIKQVLGDLEAQRAVAEQLADEHLRSCDIYDDPGDCYDSTYCLRDAEVQLEDALIAAKDWIAEKEGRTAPPRTQLLELLRAAQDAGEDVLVYHSVN